MHLDLLVCQAQDPKPSEAKNLNRAWYCGALCNCEMRVASCLNSLRVQVSDDWVLVAWEIEISNTSTGFGKVYEY